MKRAAEFPYLPKDFIETDDGFIFAVVSYHPHDQKIGCFLRYVHSGGQWSKVDTEQANRVLRRHKPQYLYHSQQFDAHFHAVPAEDVTVHHRPEVRLQQLLKQTPADDIEANMQALIAIFQDYDIDTHSLGLTGSMLINKQGPGSDIDFAVYGRKAFHQTRLAVGKAIEKQKLQPLDEAAMQDNYQRRDCELDYAEFAWHEARKFNKAIVNGTKFDIGMVCLADELERDHHHYSKNGFRTMKTRVIDASRAFDFPAYYLVDNPLTPEIVSYTHTYIGQAEAGEMIEVTGAMECDASGHCRIVVGSSREASGEYIKVCR